MNEFGVVPEEHELPARWRNVQRSYLMNEIEKHPNKVIKPKVAMRRFALMVAAFALVGGFATLNGLPNPGTGNQVEAAELVLANSEKAATGKRDVIVHSRETMHQTFDGTDRTWKSETWFDKNVEGNWRQSNYSSNGAIILDIGSNVIDGTLVRHVVDYQSKEVQVSRGEAEMTKPPLDFAALKGMARLIGNEVVNGVNTTHYKVDGNDGSNSTWESWLTEEDLPVKIISKYPDLEATSEYDWIDRTEESVAALLPVIPSGFKVVETEFLTTPTTAMLGTF